MIAIMKVIICIKNYGKPNRLHIFNNLKKIFHHM